MNIFQKRLLEIYGDGDYRHLADPSEYAALGVNEGEIGDWIKDHGGDTLLLFLWRELAMEGESSPYDEAVRRMEVSLRDVQGVLDAMESLQHDAQRCAEGLHSWVDEQGKLPADTQCTRCGEPYGDPK